MSETRIERERILLEKIETRDKRIVALERKVMKTLYASYFIGIAVGFFCCLFLWR